MPQLVGFVAHEIQPVASETRSKERDRKWGVERMVDELRTGWWK